MFYTTRPLLLHSRRRLPIEARTKLAQDRITLFDIPFDVPGRALSPSVWKTRYSLNYKRIPFVTQWVDLVDVEPLCKSLGIATLSNRRFDNRQLYTLPVIYDPKSNHIVSDSMRIAQYLDEEYPDPEYPPLIKKGTEGLTQGFIHARELALAPVHQFVVPLVAQRLHLSPRSQEYFRRTREMWFKVGNLEEILPDGDTRVVEWGKVKAGMDLIDSWYRAVGGTEGQSQQGWIMGGQPCFSDFNVAAALRWMKSVWGESSPEWSDVKLWNEGRWARMLDDCKAYENGVHL
ncbi:hypothetical protein FA15DRAFT_644212 [Coprinopsis marcescibilis]|uniref:GST N-terminal domain-containing protein n=1 Tax=Coprinopsis marcescibilis TaxID=230819 RepID=A0A5C3KPF5_COPMA|nr:hypothetical protein FA15DRAFT_644212 [Coprinopsis marcescibilis]